MKRFFIFILAAGLGATAIAQTAETGDSRKWTIAESRRLYAAKEFSTAKSLLDRLQYEKFTPTEQQEYDYMRAVTTFEIEPLNGRALMLEYIEKYPDSGKKGILATYIAQSYYFSRNFAQANEWFKSADFSRLSSEERFRSELYYALTLQELGEEEQAKSLLNYLRLTSKEYRSDAIFHLAVIDYDNNNLQQAHDAFKSIESDKKYCLEIPYYIAGIHLKKGEYTTAEEIAVKFLEENAGKRQCVSMRQILGAAYFGQERYSKASTLLKQYIDEHKEPQRIAYYQLALALFYSGNYQDAVPLFDKCTNKADAMAQNASLHQGIIQLKFNDMRKARLAFELAAAMNCDSNVREEALYNYALCIHQTRYSPFAESVKVFEQFLNEFPDSPHASQVNKYLVEVYMNTRNYDVALESIGKIENPGESILEAKQNILYRLGVQAFIDNNMQLCIDYMNRSIELSHYNKDTYSDALYWRGEAQYAIKNYNGASSSYSSAIALGGDNVGKALYGLAYTLFQKKKYINALTEYNRSLQHIPAAEATLRADIYNRIADCHFYNRNYKSAEQYYKKSIDTSNAYGDYALYRAALSQGLTTDYAGKINSLRKLINNYPNSSYANQAYYEMGRSYVEQELFNEAISSFETLTKRVPKSNLARRATAEIAMIHNRLGNQQTAINTYKKIIRDYPQSEEAQIAAQDLKSIYVEMGQIEEYAIYAASTPGMKAMESSERDTLTYIAAEKIYSRGEITEAKQQFESYLKSFPNGSFAVNSHYYLGVIYNNNNEQQEALTHFEKLLSFPDNKYTEETMAVTAELYYSGKEYRKAMMLYDQLSTSTQDEERRKACKMNVMRCAYIIGEEHYAIAAAGELLSAGNISPEWEREALYTRAKCQWNKGNKESAVHDLKKLSGDTRSKQGAEAKYLIAQYYFDNKSYDACEKEILSYIEESTPHAYWLARSFVLIADLYIAQNRLIEAKQYLLSLQHNYSGDDDIAELIKERLQIIEEKEQAQ